MADTGSQFEPCRDQVLCDALYLAGLALSASSGLLVTDRPDLPRLEQPLYVLKHDDELKAIDRAVEALSSRNGRECGRCRSRRGNTRS